MEELFKVVWPLAPVDESAFEPAARPESLYDATVAFVWDYIFRGDEMWDVIQDRLRAESPGIRFVGPDELGNIHSPEEQQVLADLPGKLRDLGVTAAIVGVAA